jgi:four helix bundle protein
MVPYVRFEAWRWAHRLALEVYRRSDGWPRDERYEVTAQLRRAALSAAANIAEGSAKRGPREFRRYLDISLGSLSELSYYLLFARDRGLLDRRDWEELDGMRNRTGKLVWCLLRAVSNSIRP